MTTENGALDGCDEKSDTVFTKTLPSGIPRDEMLKLIMQTLGDFGLRDIADQVAERTGVVLHSPSASSFRESILNGDWSKALSLLSDLGITETSKVKGVRFLVQRQKYLELLDKRDTKQALECLRNEVAPNAPEPAVLHKLTSLVMCKSTDDLRKCAFDWKGTISETRLALLRELNKFISPTELVPEGRLETLLLQAIAMQRRACPFHNSSDKSIGLLKDHSCGREAIPTQTKFVLDSLHTDEVWYVAMSHDGQHFATGSKDCTAVICDVGRIGEEDYEGVRLEGHAEAVSYVAWSPDDSFLLTCSNDNYIKLWDKNGTFLRDFLRHDDNVTAVAWFPDNASFLSVGTDKKMIKWSVNGDILKEWVTFRLNDVCLTSDGRTAVSIDHERNIRVLNLEHGEWTVLEEEDNLTSLSLSSDGRYALVNLALGKETNHETSIHLWDIQEKRIVQKFKGHVQEHYIIRSCFGGADESFVLSGSEDNCVYMWNRTSGQLMECLEGHEGPVNCVSWSRADPRIFVSASDDKTVRVWGPPS